MAWSKTTRIKVMIAIDTAFFLLELICGFLAHSLALTADAFHMVCHRGRCCCCFACSARIGDLTSLLISPQLNDIISLVIGLWAVVAAQKETTDEFTFGVRIHIYRLYHPFNSIQYKTIRAVANYITISGCAPRF